MRNDGGPAFPNPEASFQHYGVHDRYMGMSLLAYLTAEAMRSLIMVHTPHDEITRRSLAIAAKRMAIAQLKELENESR